MAKKKTTAPVSKAAPKAGPQPHTTRKLSKLGGGEVRLYDAHKAGLPELAKMPPEKELAQWQWWLVHFPSRRAVPVQGDRLEGMRLLKKLEAGKDEAGLLPPPKVKKVPETGSKGGARTHAGAGARGGEDKENGRQGDGETTPARQRLEVKVSPGLGFDAAIKEAFPNEFIIGEIARLLRAEKAVYDKEGGLVGYQDDFMTQTNAVKLMIEHAQGRAGEKPPPPPDKKKVSYEELIQMIRTSPSARTTLRRLIDDEDNKAATTVTPAEGGS